MMLSACLAWALGCLPLQTGELEQLREEKTAWVKREAELLERIESLELELARHESWRAARSQEWLAFTQFVSELELPTELPVPSYVQGLQEEAERAAQVEDPETAAKRIAAERSRKMRNDLAALLTLEHVFEFEVLELGLPAEGYTGPVVFRLLDRVGRPVGNLTADRLRLESSRAGRAVTLVFEDGRELVDGQERSFDTAEGSQVGVRRIELVDVDPAPWLASLPELFAASERTGELDDGRYDRDQLRLDVNRLLRLHAETSSAKSSWRLEGLAGVWQDQLRDVRVVQLDSEGKRLRRLFADSLSFELRGKDLWIELQEGVQERRGRTHPFLDGRYRIVLPAVDVEAWTAAELPGLSGVSPRQR